MKINSVTICSILGIIVVLYFWWKAPKKLDDVSYSEGYVLHISYNKVTISPDSTKETMHIINTIYDQSEKLSSDSLDKIRKQFIFGGNFFSFTFDGQIMSDIYHCIDSAGYAYMKIRYKSGISSGRATGPTEYLDFYQIKINDKIVYDFDFSQYLIFWYVLLIILIIICVGSLWDNKDKDDENMQDTKSQ